MLLRVRVCCEFYYQWMAEKVYIQPNHEMEWLMKRLMSGAFCCTLHSPIYNILCHISLVILHDILALIGRGRRGR